MGVGGVLNENAMFWVLSYPTFFFLNFLLFDFIKLRATASAYAKSRKIQKVIHFTHFDQKKNSHQ